MKQRVLGALGACLAVFLAIFAVGFLSARDACAHDPRFVCSPRSTARPVIVDDPQKSWAFYGHLRPGEEDHYRIEVRKPLHVPWSLLIDARDTGNPARPEAILYDGTGRRLAQLDLVRPVRFYEPFSRERYLSSRAAVLDLLPGTYAAVVRMRGGDSSQRYTLAIGESEQFSLTEIPYVLGAIARIRALHY